MADVQHRVKFDFEIEFTNGGSLHGKDSRLDIPGDAISDAALVDHVVADMRLLMAGPARIRNKRIIAEPHKRRPVARLHSTGARRYVALSHVIRSAEHTSALQTLMRTSHAVFRSKKQTQS